MNVATTKNTIRLGGSVDEIRFFYSGKNIKLVVEHRGPEDAPMLLLLPALSTVSSRGEWRNFADSIQDKYQIISFDWPGFGDSDRPKLKYNIDILRSALSAIFDYLKQYKQENLTVMAAGHSACVVLSLADDYSEKWEQLILVAPTWRGPLPSMSSWHPKYFGWLRQIVSCPIIGPILYYINTSRGILKYMLRRHVWCDIELLTPKEIHEQQKLSRQPGARFASVSFVSGGFDPSGERSWWLKKIRHLRCRLQVVVAMEAPARSKREMQILAEHAQQFLQINGRLGLHQEFGKILSSKIFSS